MNKLRVTLLGGTRVPSPLPRHSQARVLEQAVDLGQSRPVEIAGIRVLQGAESVAVADAGFIRLLYQHSVNEPGAERIAASDAVDNLQIVLHVLVELPLGIGERGPG